MSRRTIRVMSVTVVLSVALLALAGCGLRATVTIERDGSGAIGYEFVMPESLLEMSAEEGGVSFDDAIAEAQAAADAQGVTVRRVEDGSDAGIGWYAEFEEADEFSDAIERLNAAMSESDDAAEAGASSPPFNSGELEVSKGIFRTTYRVTIDYKPAGDASDLGEGYEGMDDAALQDLMGEMGLESEVLITMPGKVDDTNGDVDEDEPTVAVFDLPLYGTEARTLTVVSHETNWLIPGILIGVGVIGLAFVGWVLLKPVLEKRRREAAARAAAIAAMPTVAPAPAPAPAPEVAPAPAPEVVAAPAPVPAPAPEVAPEAVAAPAPTGDACPVCGALRLADSAFCTTCGSPLA